MNMSEIDSVLKDVASWGSASKDVRDAFAGQMKGRQYGRPALTDAWVWFLSGWNTADSQ